MANPHFQNIIQWAGNNTATLIKKDIPMFAPLPSDQTYYQYTNDFMEYTAADWTVTAVQIGAGNLTVATQNGAGGQVLLTNAANIQDSGFLQLVKESFLLLPTKKAFFEARFKISNATQSRFVMGLQKLDTTPLAATDGVYFIKSDGDTDIKLNVEKNNTTITTNGAGVLADDTFTTMTWMVDPTSGSVFYSQDHGTMKSVPYLTSLPDDQTLSVSWGMENGSAGVKTMVVDYITAIVER